MCLLGRGCVFLSFKAIHGVLSVGQVWHIRLTIHVLSDAGNMVDCACLAGIVALKHFRRPEVEVEGDEVTIVCPPPYSRLSELVSRAPTLPLLANSIPLPSSLTLTETPL